MNMVFICGYGIGVVFAFLSLLAHKKRFSPIYRRYERLSTDFNYDQLKHIMGLYNKFCH